MNAPSEDFANASVMQADDLADLAQGQTSRLRSFKALTARGADLLALRLRSLEGSLRVAQLCMSLLLRLLDHSAAA